MAKNPKLQSVQGGALRLTLAASVAHDLGALQTGLKNLAEHLGHTACFTGCDMLHIGMEREFVINSKSELNPQPLPPVSDISFAISGRLLPQDPIPVVNVSVPGSVLNDIEKLNRVTASVLGKLGCSECCSGFDIAFRRELEQFRVDEQLNVHGAAISH